MWKQRNILWIAATILLFPCIAHADTPAGTWRFFGLHASPSGDFSGTIDGIPAGIEADSTVGFGTTYEIRTSEWLGFEFGLLAADFDFKLSAMGQTIDFGSALMMPLTFGMNVHVVRGERVGVHLGPVAAYTLWGNLETSVGTAELDGSFDLGAKVGLDLSIGSSGWAIHVGALYLTSAAGDSSLEIGVDPLMVQVGFAKSF